MKAQEKRGETANDGELNGNLEMKTGKQGREQEQENK